MSLEADNHAPAPASDAARSDPQLDRWQIRVADRLAAFPDWPRSDRMGEAHCHVFQCADIIEVWLDTIGRAGRTRPVLVAVADAAGRPAMLLPLGIERRFGVRVLGFLDGTVVDYAQPVLYPPAAALDRAGALRLWQRILAALPGFDVAILDKMPAEVGGFANPLLHLPCRRMPESGHVMDIGASREDLEARIPVQKGHRRLHRKLRREHAVAFEIAATPAQTQLFLDAMIENKTRRFSETRVPGFEVPGKRAFYVAATDRLANLTPIHLSAITVDGTVIASHWGLVFGDRFYFLMTTYAGGAWRRYGAGRMLNAELILWSHAQGYRWFDFGIGDEAYKFEYCDVVVPLHIAAIPATLRGRLYLGSGAVLTRLRASTLWQRLRPYKWVLRRRFQRDRPEQS